jgi:anaerobic C4-dicarboxylate transporter
MYFRGHSFSPDTGSLSVRSKLSISASGASAALSGSKLQLGEAQTQFHAVVQLLRFAAGLEYKIRIKSFQDLRSNSEVSLMLVRPKLNQSKEKSKMAQEVKKQAHTSLHFSTDCVRSVKTVACAVSALKI